MDISTKLFLIPVLLALILIIQSMLRKTIKDIKQYKIGDRKQGTLEILVEIIDRINVLVPKKGTKIYKAYEALLGFTRFSVKQLFRVKFILFVLTVAFLLLKAYTDIGIYTKDIFNRFDYYCDLLYQYKGEVKEKDAALEYEIDCLKTALNEISKNETLKASKEDIQGRIKGYIKAADDSLAIPRDTIANKVYYRLYDYYRYRQINYVIILLVALLISFLPEALVFLFNFFARADARRELRFLKKLIIVNGSIKPVDFMELLGTLIDRSRYYKGMLQEIQDANKRNNIDNKAIYSAYISSARDLDTKLFYEKLDQANNYDFDQAILNIQNEFKMEKREQARKVKKRIDLINILGIMVFMILIVIVIMYLLIPWMRSYNMSQMM